MLLTCSTQMEINVHFFLKSQCHYFALIQIDMKVYFLTGFLSKQYSISVNIKSFNILLIFSIIDINTSIQFNMDRYFFTKFSLKKIFNILLIFSFLTTISLSSSMNQFFLRIYKLLPKCQLKSNIYQRSCQVKINYTNYYIF